MVVTGASGYLGREVVRLAVAGGWDVVGLSRHRRVGGAVAWAQLDVRDADGIAALSRRIHPTAMVHAAYQRTGPDAPATIVNGSRIVAAAANEVGARLVHVSTDLVFGGRPAHYEDSELPSPVDDYGAWKAAAENAVAQVCPAAVVVRPSLLWGEESLSPAQTAVLAAIDGTRPARFFTDEVRCPSHVVDVASCLVALCSPPLTAVGGPLNLGGPDALTRYELARAVAAWAGRPADLVHPGRRREHPEPRPGHVVLDSRRAGRLGLCLRSPLAALRPLDER